jgi:hypothetical protein
MEAEYMGESPTVEDAVKRFRNKALTVKDDKNPIDYHQVELKDPNLSAQLLNRMIVELQDFISKNQLTVAKRNRIFIEEQLKTTK